MREEKEKKVEGVGEREACSKIKLSTQCSLSLTHELAGFLFSFYIRSFLSISHPLFFLSERKVSCVKSVKMARMRARIRMQMTMRMGMRGDEMRGGQAGRQAGKKE